MGAAHGEDIDERAPDRIFPMLEHRIHAPIPRSVETPEALISIELITLAEGEGAPEEPVQGGDAVEEGGDRAHQDTPTQRGEGRQGCQALGNDRLVGGKAVVGERFPVREVEHLRVRGLAQEEGQLTF